MSRTALICRGLVALGALLIGCGDAGQGQEGQDQTGTTSSDILGGSLAPLPQYSATGFIHRIGETNNRLCTATRIRKDVVLTAGHCLNYDYTPAHYQFGWGNHSLDSAVLQGILRISVLSGPDVALLQTATCANPTVVAPIVAHNELSNMFTMVTYLHEKDRDGQRAKAEGVNVYQYSGWSFYGYFPNATIWGGDSGSPLYWVPPTEQATVPSNGALVGILVSKVGGDNYGGFQSVSDPQVLSQIKDVLSAWPYPTHRTCWMAEIAQPAALD